jgi:hypothetical protein
VRSQLIQAEAFITGDRYTFIRDAYLQRRRYLVLDGKMPDDEEFDEFGSFGSSGDGFGGESYGGESYGGESYGEDYSDVESNEAAEASDEIEAKAVDSSEVDESVDNDANLPQSQ